MMTAPSVDAIISRLRPRDIGGIIDQAFRLYRKHFLTFLAIAAVAQVPLQLLIQVIQLVIAGPANHVLNSYIRDLQSGNYSPTTGNELLVNQGLYNALNYLLLVLRTTLLALPQAAITVAVIDSYSDREVSFGGAYRAVFKRPGPLLGVMGVLLLISVGVFGFSGLSALSGLLVTTEGSLVYVCCGFLAGLIVFVFSVYYYVRLKPVVAVLMSENLGVRAALRRSSQLTLGSWWRTAGLLLLIFVLGAIVSAGPAALVAGIVAFFFKFDFVINQTVTGAVSVATTTLFLPIVLVTITLYYYDLRARKEGYDLEAAIRQTYAPDGYGNNLPPGYGAYGQGQTAPNSYRQGEQGQLNPMYPPVLGYEQQEGGDTQSMDKEGSEV